jgi:DNA-binding NtrC family response regulator
MKCTILIVDDETQLAAYLARLLRTEGHQVFHAATAAEARRAMAEHCPDVVLEDLMLPDADGAQLMVELKETHPESEFIIITAHGSIRSAVEATQRGAADYLTKPFEPEAVSLAIQRVMERRALDEEVRRLRAGPGGHGGTAAPGEASSRSEAMRQVLHLMRRAAAQDGIVLLLGESGTGKDHYARWIHEQSRRAAGPFRVINCAAVSRELAESELFGHEPGAFTGTRGRKRGMLELAEHGTLLLDEIGDLEPVLQSKLLTFLDTRSFLRVGGETTVTVDARLIAATNRDLAADTEQGRFRRDLYYRLNVLPVRIPPLRERIEDLPELAAQILARLAAELGLPAPPELDAAALDALGRYAWPGNIRELRNVLERATMLSDGRRIVPANLSLEAREERWALQVPFPTGSGANLHDVTREVQERLIREALRRATTRQEAARLLGITRHSLTHYLKTLKIED